MAKIVPVKLKEPVISSGEEDELADEDNFQQSWQGNSFIYLICLISALGEGNAIL